MKVIEISQREIRYKKCLNLQGPIYAVPVSDVFMIVYANGQKDLFGNDTAPSNQSSSNYQSSNQEPLPNPPAVTAVVMGLLSVPASVIPLLGWLFGFAAISFATKGSTNLKNSKSPMKGRTAISVGMGLGILGVVLSTLAFIANLVALGVI